MLTAGLAAIAFVVRDSHLLLMQRPPNANDPWAGKWSIIGGRFDPGETPEACMARELEEESGLTCGRLDYRGQVLLYGTQDDSVTSLHLFAGTDPRGELRGSHEGLPQWVPLAEVEFLDLIGYIRTLLPLVLTPDSFLAGSIHVNLAGDTVAAHLEHHRGGAASAIRQAEPLAVRPFSDLNPAETDQLFAFLSRFQPAPYPDREAMVRALSGIPYEGRSFLTLWCKGALQGTIGVITRDAAARHEVFLTGLYARPNRLAGTIPTLVEAAYDLARRTPGVPADSMVRLGLREASRPLIPAVTAVGFEPAYRILELRRPMPQPAPSADETLRWEPVGGPNRRDCLQVQNEAFVHSPNGALLTPEVLDQCLADLAAPDLMQVGYVGSRPAAMLELEMDGSVGKIEALAVAPGFQGQGLGRKALEQAFRTLAGHGATEALLNVVESNTRALDLYLKAGFQQSQVLATWFTGPHL
jgi:8-oxo-dGTP diphosphatase